MIPHARVAWWRLELVSADNQDVQPESPEGRAALAEYRATGTMLDYFLRNPVTGDYDADTGPKPDGIDWSGF